MLCNTVFSECTSVARVRVVRVLIVDGDRSHVVITHKADKPYWELGISGWLEPGEDAFSAGVREMMEELGVSCRSLHYLGEYYIEQRDLWIGALMTELLKFQPFLVNSELDAAMWIALDANGEIHILPEHVALLNMIVPGGLCKEQRRKKLHYDMKHLS